MDYKLSGTKLPSPNVIPQEFRPSGAWALPGKIPDNIAIDPSKTKIMSCDGLVSVYIPVVGKKQNRSLLSGCEKDYECGLIDLLY
mmetsp:Transcript_39054/g.61822  ORF Transcript_39054/g.61822 Transcript_39054/m.61822 type:complete len:85 (-) Transcript_39054:73-327(-)